MTSYVECMSALKKLRERISALLDSKDTAACLEAMGYSEETAKALAASKGIRSAKSLRD